MPLDFTAPPEVVRVLAEGERLSFGHMFNPVFATEISQIDPLPHQRIAVYEHMLRQSPLRFLLAELCGVLTKLMGIAEPPFDFTPLSEKWVARFDVGAGA